MFLGESCDSVDDLLDVYIPDLVEFECRIFLSVLHVKIKVHEFTDEKLICHSSDLICDCGESEFEEIRVILRECV